MLIKLLIVALLLFMLFNLFSAMLVMLKNDQSKGPMSKYIGRRVMASMAIIMVIIVAVVSGFITLNPRPW